MIYVAISVDIGCIIFSVSTVSDQPTPLPSKNIISLTDWLFHKDKFDVQDLFHKMYHSRKTDLPYEKYGIKEISVILNIFEDNKKLIPLGEIFKNIHATENMLMMNYNPGLGKENVLRLYSNSISTNGKVIPLLKMKEISVVLSNIKLTSATAKVQPLQNENVVIRHERKKITTYIIVDDVEIFIHLYQYGKIKVKSKHDLPMSSEEWDKILQKARSVSISNLEKGKCRKREKNKNRTDWIHIREKRRKS